MPDREILCKAKRLDNGGWVEGYYVSLGDEYHYIFTGKLDITGLYPTFVRYEVDPSTISRYTGRTAQCTDKIFAGDICIVTVFDHNGLDYQYKCQVVWCDGAFFFDGIEDEFWMCMADVQDTDSDVEVIGNRWDNPEQMPPPPGEEDG